jgi:hypothetical protein
MPLPAFWLLNFIWCVNNYIIILIPYEEHINNVRRLRFPYGKWGGVSHLCTLGRVYEHVSN